jgi:hypothetical protein
MVLLWSINSFGQSERINKKDRLEYNCQLILRNGSFRKFGVRGVFSIMDDGVRFSPDTVFTSRGDRRIYRYNFLIKEIFIPYSSIKQIKLTTIFTLIVFPIVTPMIITKDLKKFKFWGIETEPVKKAMIKHGYPL